MSLALVSCETEQSSQSLGHSFKIIHGEINAGQTAIGVVKDEAIVSSVTSAIAPEILYVKNTLCVISPVLGSGGYTYEVDVVEKPQNRILTSLIKEDVMGTAVLHHRVVCLIPNNPNVELPEVILKYDEASFGLNRVKK